MDTFLSAFGAFALAMLVAILLFSFAVWLSNADDRRELRRRFGNRASCRGSLSILGGSGYQRGVAMQETGINCESFECRYFPEVNDKLQGIGGETFVKAVSAKMSRDVTLDGEVNAATGVMAFTTTTACTVANAVNAYGDGTGTLLYDEATVSANRTAWEKASVKLSSNPNLVLT